VVSQNFLVYAQKYGIKEPDLKEKQYILNIVESNMETIF
jgi:transcriptional regulatory protein LevR